MCKYMLCGKILLVIAIHIACIALVYAANDESPSTTVESRYVTPVIMSCSGDADDLLSKAITPTEPASAAGPWFGYYSGANAAAAITTMSPDGRVMVACMDQNLIRKVLAKVTPVAEMTYPDLLQGNETSDVDFMRQAGMSLMILYTTNSLGYDVVFFPKSSGSETSEVVLCDPTNYCSAITPSSSYQAVFHGLQNSPEREFQLVTEHYGDEFRSEMRKLYTLGNESSKASFSVPVKSNGEQHVAVFHINTPAGIEQLCRLLDKATAKNPVAPEPEYGDNQCGFVFYALPNSQLYSIFETCVKPNGNYSASDQTADDTTQTDLATDGSTNKLDVYKSVFEAGEKLSSLRRDRMSEDITQTELTTEELITKLTAWDSVVVWAFALADGRVQLLFFEGIAPGMNEA